MAKKLSPMEQKASSKVLDELRAHAQGMMKDKMAGLKKVTVASDSSEGLKKGLSKAEELLDMKKKGASDDLESPDDEMDKQTEDESSENTEGDEMESPEEEASESPDYEHMEEECKTPEEVDAKIKELLKLKQDLLAKK